jgi:hypothetical protein
MLDLNRPPAVTKSVNIDFHLKLSLLHYPNYFYWKKLSRQHQMPTSIMTHRTRIVGPRKTKSNVRYLRKDYSRIKEVLWIRTIISGSGYSPV